jgi:hypothetical protein
MTTLASAGSLPGNVTDSYPHFCGGTEVLTEVNWCRSCQNKSQTQNPEGAGMTAPRFVMQTRKITCR